MDDLIQALQLIALDAVVHPDSDAKLREIFRHYSEKWHTPLHVVQELPLANVLLNYYEDVYAEMSPDQREQMRVELLMTEEERSAAIAEEERAEVEAQQWEEQIAREEAAKQKKAETKKLSDLALSAKKMTASMEQLVETLNKAPDRPLVEAPRRKDSDMELPDSVEQDEAPGIHMTFAEDLFPDEDMDVMSPIKKRPAP